MNQKELGSGDDDIFTSGGDAQLQELDQNEIDRLIESESDSRIEAKEVTDAGLSNPDDRAFKNYIADMLGFDERGPSANPYLSFFSNTPDHRDRMEDGNAAETPSEGAQLKDGDLVSDGLLLSDDELDGVTGSARERSLPFGQSLLPKPNNDSPELDFMKGCKEDFVQLRSDEDATDTHVHWPGLQGQYAEVRDNPEVKESPGGPELLQLGDIYFESSPFGPTHASKEPITAAPMNVARTLQKLFALSFCKKLSFGKDRSLQEAEALLYGDTGRGMHTCQDCAAVSGEAPVVILIVATSTDGSLVDGVRVEVRCFSKGRTVTCATLELDGSQAHEHSEEEVEEEVARFAETLPPLLQGRKLILAVQHGALVEVAVAESWESRDLKKGSTTFSPANDNHTFKSMKATLGSEKKKKKCTCEVQPCLQHMAEARLASRTILSTIKKKHGYNRALIFALLFVNNKGLLPAVGLQKCTSKPVRSLALGLLCRLQQRLRGATKCVRDVLLQAPDRKTAWTTCLPAVIDVLLVDSNIVRREDSARLETLGGILQGGKADGQPEQWQPVAVYLDPYVPTAVNDQKIPAGCTEEGFDPRCDSLVVTGDRNRRMYRRILEEMEAQGLGARDELTKLCNTNEKIDVVMRVARQQFREEAPERFHDTFSSFLKRHELTDPFVQSAICVAFVEILKSKSAVHVSSQKPNESPREATRSSEEPKRRKCSYGMSRAPTNSRSGQSRNSFQSTARICPPGDLAEDGSGERPDPRTPLASLLARLRVLLLFARLLQPASSPEDIRVSLLGKVVAALEYLGVQPNDEGAPLLKSPPETYGLRCAHLLKAGIDARLDFLFTYALEAFLPRDAPGTWKSLLEQVSQLVFWRSELSRAESGEDAGPGLLTKTVADAAKRGEQYAMSLNRRVGRVAETGNCGWQSFGRIARISAIRLKNTAAPWYELPEDKIGKLLVRLALAEKSVKEFFGSERIASLIREIRTPFISDGIIKAVAIAYRRHIYVIDATNTKNWTVPGSWNGDPPVRVYSCLCDVENEYEAGELYQTVFSPKIGPSDIVLILTNHGETDNGEDMLHLQPTIGYGTEYSQDQESASANVVVAVRPTDQKEWGKRKFFASPEESVPNQEVIASADSLSELQLSDDDEGAGDHVTGKSDNASERAPELDPHLTPIEYSADSTLCLSEKFSELWTESANDVKVFEKLVLGLNLTKEALGEQLRRIRLPKWRDAQWESTCKNLNILLMASLRSIVKATKIEVEASSPVNTETHRRRLDELGKSLIKHNIKLQVSMQFLAVEHDVGLRIHLESLEQRFNGWFGHLQRRMKPSASNRAIDGKGDTIAMDVESQDVSTNVESVFTDVESVSTDVESQGHVRSVSKSDTLSMVIGRRSWKPRESTFDFIEEQLKAHRSALESYEKSARDNPEHEQSCETLRSMMRRLASALPESRLGRHEAHHILYETRRALELREEQLKKIVELWKLTEEDLASLRGKVSLAPSRKLLSQERRNSARMEAVQTGLYHELLILTKLAQGDGRRGFVQRFMGFLETSTDFTGINFYFEKNILGSLDDLGSLFDCLNRKGKDLPGSRRYLSTVLYEMFFGAAHGLEFLHDHGILHRDVRPCNLLVFSCDSGLGLTAKLGNFASAKELDNRITHTALDKTQVNEDYIAPEVAHPLLDKTQDYIAPEACREEGIETARYSYPADYWSFGKILEIFSRELFEADPHDKRRKALEHIVRISRDRDPSLRYGRCTYDGLRLSEHLADVRRTAGEEHCGEAQIFGIRLRDALERHSRSLTRQ